MEKYLSQILETNNRVIVPEFGAFIIKQKKPLIILFNEFLQYNDGVLVDTVAKSEGIDTTAAKQQIENFVSNVTSELDSNGSYLIPGIGVLVRSATGKISIESEETKISTKKTGKPVSESKTAPKPKAKSVKKSVSSEVELDEQDDKQNKPDIQEEKERVAEPEKRDPVVLEVKHEEKPKPPVIEKRQEPEIKHPVETSIPLVANEHRKGKSRLMLWLLVIIIVNGLLIGYFIYSDQLTGLFTKQPSDEEISTFEDNQLVPEITPAEVPVESVPAEEPVITTEQPEVNVSSPVSGPAGGFYVVAGVFREESNADNLVSELRKKGYKAEKFGKIGSLHAVCYERFQTRGEANIALREIQEEIDPEAWIREVK